MTDPDKIQDFTVTQSSRDGGRDVVGKYKIGTNNNSYKFSYHLEAKDTNLMRNIGVKKQVD